MKIYIGSDHGGYNYKTDLIDFLEEMDHEVIDCGTFSNESVDYPDYAQIVSENVVVDNGSLGILICGTGLGVSIMANKKSGIRAALAHDIFSAKAAKEHNNANVLCIGQRVIGMGLAKMIVETFINTDFSNEQRHIIRVNKINEYGGFNNG